MFSGFYIFAAQNQILISMCGIVGYIGPKKAYPILIKGLKRLEYRGYDSAGVALISDNRQLNVYKTKGKVSELETFVTQKDISGNIGIAHTRWATHGEPCSANAHPHYSSSEHLAHRKLRRPQRKTSGQRLFIQKQYGHRSIGAADRIHPEIQKYRFADCCAISVA